MARNTLTARDFVHELLLRCVEVARAEVSDADDAREANVFRLASMVLGAEFTPEATRLLKAAKRYFARFPGQQLRTPDVIARGWVLGLPRLHDMLERELSNSTFRSYV